MGFSDAKVAKALKKTRNAGLQPAMDWLLEHSEEADDFEEEEDIQDQEIDQAPAVFIPELSEQERAQRVAALQQKMIFKREQKRLQAIEDEKSKEKVRRSTGQEMQSIKEKLQQDEMAKQVADRKREKDEDLVARQRVRAQLEQDKADRQLLADERKRLAAGTPLAAAPIKSVPKTIDGNYTEARIQIRLPSGPITHVFSVLLN